jgi:putative FmdB family regulatory protein
LTGTAAFPGRGTYNFLFCIKGLAMPIYAYRCATCGHAQDVLQKISDPLLTVCPSCGAETFVKQVTAAGFQLKGSGWYVTDFRGGNATKEGKPAAEGDKPADKPGDKVADKAPDTAAAKSEPAPAAPVAAPPPAAPASGTGSST